MYPVSALLRIQVPRLCILLCEYIEEGGTSAQAAYAAAALFHTHGTKHHPVYVNHLELIAAVDFVP
jgi:hypothetical protein